jgi:hypothetical protein
LAQFTQGNHQFGATAQPVLNLYPLPNINAGKTYNNYAVNINTNQNTAQ